MQVRFPFITVSILAVSLAAGPLVVSAAEEPTPNHPALNDRFSITGGLLYAESSTNAALAGNVLGAGVVINFEDTLGMEDRNLTGIFGFLWRFSERWRLEAEYFRLNRNATRALATEIEWEGVTYPIGTEVHSVFDFYDLRLSAGYSFFKRRDKELGAGLGVHVARVKASISATSVGEGDGKVLAPLPTVNLYGNFALTDEWALRFRIDWFSLTYEEYGGDLTSSGMDVLYQPFRHVGLGLGFRHYTLNAEYEQPHWRGVVDMRFNGPTAFLTVSF